MRLLPLMLLVGTVAQVGAVTYLNDANFHVTAILDLDVEGTLYDVSFDGSFGNQTIFLGNQAGAESAMGAIAFAMNGYINGPYQGGFNSNFAPFSGGVTLVETPFRIEPPNLDLPLPFEGFQEVAGTFLVGGYTTYTGLADPARNAPGFRLSVPEPSAAALAGVGLLAALRRKRDGE